MTYDIYIKGVSEPTYRASAYAIYDSQGKLIHEHRLSAAPNPAVSTTIMSFCMELYAASHAVHAIPDDSSVRIHTNNKTVASWINKMKQLPPPYAPFWEQFATVVVQKHLIFIQSQWQKKGTCPRLDSVRQKAFQQS